MPVKSSFITQIKVTFGLSTEEVNWIYDTCEDDHNIGEEDLWQMILDIPEVMNIDTDPHNYGIAVYYEVYEGGSASDLNEAIDQTRELINGYLEL